MKCIAVVLAAALGAVAYADIVVQGYADPYCEGVSVGSGDYTLSECYETVSGDGSLMFTQSGDIVELQFFGDQYCQTAAIRTMEAGCGACVSGTGFYGSYDMVVCSENPGYSDSAAEATASVAAGLAGIGLTAAAAQL